MTELQMAAQFAADTLGIDRYMNVYAQEGEWQSLRRRAVTAENAYLEARFVANSHVNGLVTNEDGDVQIATVYADGSYVNHMAMKEGK